MNIKALNQIDLKLLLSLQVLIEEGSVTRAAERLHVTQPAMSKTLQRLREALGDPLFTRTSRGLVPTPKTQQLTLKLPGLLDQLNALINEQGFVPAECRNRFRIATVELLSPLLFSPLVQELYHSAPQVQIIESPLNEHYLEDLANGKLDFAVHLTSSCPEGFHASPLGNSTASCLMRADHPLSHKPQMTMEDYLSYPHVRVYFSRMTLNDVGFIDQLLAAQGKRRHIIFETTHITTALEILCNTDCLVVGSPFFALVGQQSHNICERPFPVEINFPNLQFALIQHERTRSSSAHQWLLQQIMDLIENSQLIETE